MNLISSNVAQPPVLWTVLFLSLLNGLATKTNIVKHFLLHQSLDARIHETFEEHNGAVNEVLFLFISVPDGGGVDQLVLAEQAGGEMFP